MIRTRTHKSRWHLRSIALVLFSIAIAGCGGNSLTGGSIPVGAARLRGIVVRADNTSTVAPGANMVLVLDGKSAQRLSDASGGFDFGSIPGGSYVCKITPRPGSGLGHGWAWPFELPDGEPAWLVAALWPFWFDPATVREVRVAPDSINLKVGDSLRFTVTVKGQGGITLPVAASMLRIGDIGDLDSDATFHATKAGTGKVLAWMPGYFATATITVTQ